MSRTTTILIRNHHIGIPNPDAFETAMSDAEFATILCNIAYYGWALSEEAASWLKTITSAQAQIWWPDIEAAFKEITGANRKMEEHVVYKNFPKEVLDMSQSEYWLKQILMYWGFPNQWFTQPEVVRPALADAKKYKVLQLETASTISAIYARLLSSPVRWTEEQRLDVEHIAASVNAQHTNALAVIPFKENLVSLAAFFMKKGIVCSVNTPTDVLRLSAALSDADISLRTKVKFKNFSRSERRFLLGMLESSLHGSTDDFVKRAFFWKKLLKALHPGDYVKTYPKTCAVYDALYNDNLEQTILSKIEEGITLEDATVLLLLQARPGEFARRLRATIHAFGSLAASSFIQVMPKLETIQLLKLRGNLETMNTRKTRSFPPNGNWAKLQIAEAGENTRIDEAVLQSLVTAISEEIRKRVSAIVPSVDLDPRMNGVKLKGNDEEFSEYGRGTVFPLPATTKFIRSASYWKIKSSDYVWFDNGWNFFDANWKSLASCCWNVNQALNKAAIFSGDPTNTKDMEGRACQMIDLYPDKLRAAGVRYAVWNILAYSKVAFSDAEDVLGTLQHGENPGTGKLFEPSRCQFSFQLKGKNMSKYLILLDLESMELIYMDANLYGQVSSANSNQEILEKTMPAFTEYMATLPSVADLFRGIPQSSDGLKVYYSDENISLSGEKAYISRPTNKKNSFEGFDVNTLL